MRFFGTVRPRPKGADTGSRNRPSRLGISSIAKDTVLVKWDELQLFAMLYGLRDDSFLLAHLAKLCDGLSPLCLKELQRAARKLEAKLERLIEDNT
jgi:hypothetical protein